MVDPIFAGDPGPLRILEVGAGVGPFTAEIVRRLRPDDRLDVVELNPDFCGVLEERFGDAPNPPHIHQMSVTDFVADAPYHHIVSGLPLANFPIALVEDIYAKFREVLMPDGTFIMFEHMFFRDAIRRLGSKRHRIRIRQVMELENQLSPLIVHTRDILFNVPPARVTVRRRPEIPPRLTG